MKNIRLFLLCLALGLPGLSSIALADDIDIYSDSAGTFGVPNVLFVIDNGANFEASGGSTPCTAYASGGAPSLGSSNGGIQQCALVDAIEALPAGTVNIGLLVGNANNFAKGYTGKAANHDAYYETCDQSTGYGGCVIRPLTLMNATNKASLIRFIKSWTTSGSDSSTAFNVKAGGNKTANMMQEAWAYYNGKTGMSGRNYLTSLAGAGCQKNFVIFVANAAGSSSTPADTPAGADAGAALTATQVGATAAQQAKIVETANFKSLTCGVTSLAPGAQSSNWSSNWGDEWARLMYQQDASSILDSMQKIVTYAVGITGSNCKPDYPALLTTAAKYGGGKYFSASGAVELKLALDAILNEIQAVNSVFSSASLPVSVNAQGTYLNQIFLGMFRPDASANPRWVGNLKQYQFVLIGANPATAELKLGDSNGNEAISSAGTGFITPGAVSFWTKDSATQPDGLVANGFFKNDINRPVGRDSYDSPDGELVERGGAAQQSRIQNLTADFAAAAGSSSNPRRLYTYCPSGNSCNASLTDASNAFAVSNTGIVASTFGASTTIAINSIVRTGTTALVTTAGSHGFTAGTTQVTISNVTQPEYNVTQTISSPSSANTFTITGLGDYPSSPNTGIYTAALRNSSPSAITSVALASSTTANASGCASGTIPNINCNQVTVTLPSHGYSNGNLIAITGVATSPLLIPNPYSGTFTIGNVTTNTFTYNVPVTPRSPSVNAYSAQLPPPAPKTITQIAKSGGNAQVTATAHGYTNGQSVTISGNSNPLFNGTWVVSGAAANTFLIPGPGGNPGNGTGGQATLNRPATPIAVGNISRASATATTATATGITASAFSSGQTILLAYVSGNGTNETEYAKLTGSKSVTITCSGTCTSFTFPITTNTGASTTLTTSSPTAALSASPVSIPAGAITRSSMNTTATVTGVANTFASGDVIDISVSGSAVGTESAYLSPAGGWTISCAAAGCNPFTFGPVTLTPSTPATGINMQAYSASSPPDRDSLIKWVRGHDNFGDELGPGGSVTVRPSIHGDVLHSRPVVINYGDARGLVVFYGANDGVFRAVNGSQTTALASGGVPPGGELWGLVLPEHFNDLNRQRVNSPELKLPSTQLASAQPKDYFVDGSPGAYQKIDADGKIDKAYLYLTMRRGGRFIYALDVTIPTAPTFLWRKSFVDGGFEEMGQTWSRPRVTLVKGYANPVLVFGAGYDPAEDAEPPAVGTMGRGIFVLDAVTGERVWSAVHTSETSACSGSGTQAACVVLGMNYAIPADISFVDRDNDGKTDRFYAADLGGNVWRVDLEPGTFPVSGQNVDMWQVTKLAALGCETGSCASGTTPRKFFFPPNVLAVGATGASGSFDVVLLGSGDREHPLKSTAVGSSYNVTNRFYALKDTTTGKDASGITAITEATLFDATSATYAGTLSGFYTTFATGEKSVNAPATLRGTTFFGTNKPTPPSVNSCSSNLGEAKGYALNPFRGTFTSAAYDGGGLPPSPTTGIVTILVDGKPIQKEFCVGCGGGGGPGLSPEPCNSALEACTPTATVPKNPRRTYWYKK